MKFKLMDQPYSYQLSVRLNNLITTYGSKAVFTNLDVYLNNCFEIKTFLEDPKFKVKKRDNNLMLAINIIQTIRYFGPDFIKDYINQIYTKKVG